MDSAMLALLVTQALAVIGAMFKVWFAFGKLVQQITDIEKRVARLEYITNHRGV